MCCLISANVVITTKMSEHGAPCRRSGGLSFVQRAHALGLCDFKWRQMLLSKSTLNLLECIVGGGAAAQRGEHLHLHLLTWICGLSVHIHKLHLIKTRHRNRFGRANGKRRKSMKRSMRPLVVKGSNAHAAKDKSVVLEEFHPSLSVVKPSCSSDWSRLGFWDLYV